MYEISKTNLFNLNFSGREVEIFNKVKAKLENLSILYLVIFQRRSYCGTSQNKKEDQHHKNRV